MGKIGQDTVLKQKTKPFISLGIRENLEGPKVVFELVKTKRHGTEVLNEEVLARSDEYAMIAYEFKVRSGEHVMQFIHKRTE